MIDVKALKVNKMYKDFVTDILKNHYLCKIAFLDYQSVSKYTTCAGAHKRVGFKKSVFVKVFN